MELTLDLHQIGGRIGSALLRANASQATAAKEIGVSQSYVSKLVAGRMKPSLKFLYGLQQRYGISADWVLTGENKTPHSPLLTKLPPDWPQTSEEAEHGFVKEGGPATRVSHEVAALEVEVERLRAGVDTEAGQWEGEVARLPVLPRMASLLEWPAVGDEPL